MSRLEIFTFENNVAVTRGNPATNICHLEVNEVYTSEQDVTKETLSESYGLDALEPDTFPLSFKYIDKYQSKDSSLMGKLKSSLDTAKDNGYHTKSIRGGGNEYRINLL